MDIDRRFNVKRLSNSPMAIGFVLGVLISLGVWFVHQANPTTLYVTPLLLVWDLFNISRGPAFANAHPLISAVIGSFIHGAFLAATCGAATLLIRRLDKRAPVFIYGSVVALFVVLMAFVGHLGELP